MNHYGLLVSLSGALRGLEFVVFAIFDHYYVVCLVTAQTI